jgi:hypothetical protein
MTSFTTRVYETVGRHFVTLSCVKRLPTTDTEKVFIFSGFVVDVADVWFYVTAGHILKDIRTAIAAGNAFDVWRLGDHTAGNKFRGIAIPYAFGIEDWLVLEDADKGLDYAAVPLSDLYRRLLEAGGVVAIEKGAWGAYVPEHDSWVLVGIPSETVDYDQKTSITARVVVVPLTPTDEPPLAQGRAQNQFYAKLSEDSKPFLKDVDGMSGGPIFALRKVNEVWKYGVIGVQSAWYPTSRAIAACPFGSFGQALEDMVNRARSRQLLA